MPQLGQVSTQVSPWHPRATPAPSSWTTEAVDRHPSARSSRRQRCRRRCRPLPPPYQPSSCLLLLQNPPSAPAHHRHCSHRRRHRFSSCRPPPLWPPPTAALARALRGRPKGREREKKERREEEGKERMTCGAHMSVAPTFFMCLNDKRVTHIRF
ncbi:hypothetical protein [Oryza sativa Japonica Group]|uniref:Uncharacterized protein n=1 Tax=Oryza sativa subsp. japonica TaxID=39947 RepID=Q5JKD2_ORYSJ|nr:hypothetical protein [Oryza sativa Japonica Group]